MKMKHYVLVSNSMDAMALYQAMEDKKIKSTLAPTPREADHCCGVCILYYDENDKDMIKKISEELTKNIDDFYSCENKDDPNRYKFC